MFTCSNALTEQFLVNVLLFSVSLLFPILYVSMLSDDTISPPVKESGSVLFPYANNCVMPLVVLVADHFKYDVNNKFLCLTVKQPFSNTPSH